MIWPLPNCSPHLNHANDINFWDWSVILPHHQSTEETIVNTYRILHLGYSFPKISINGFLYNSKWSRYFTNFIQVIFCNLLCHCLLFWLMKLFWNLLKYQSITDIKEYNRNEVPITFPLYLFVDNYDSKYRWGMSISELTESNIRFVDSHSKKQLCYYNSYIIPDNALY